LKVFRDENSELRDNQPLRRTFEKHDSNYFSGEPECGNRVMRLFGTRNFSNRTLGHIGAIFSLLFLCGAAAFAQSQQPKFKVIALAEANSIHKPFVDAAKIWLEKEALAGNFSIDYIQNTEKIDDAFLSRYQLFLQLDFPPYAWTPVAVSAFEKYIEEGRGGWVGFHHATLLGEFDGYPMWSWFSGFMGGIRFKDYIASFANAKVNVEDQKHPVMRGLGASFEIEREEWYTYDKSPRQNVRVLASVDEKSYVPDSPLKMGDHPVVWTNEHVKARNVYIFMGHRAEHFHNPAFTTLFRNSIFWAANR
jgi:type 1 glutamine amidotransferase